MSNTPTESEFDKELKDIQENGWWCVSKMSSVNFCDSCMGVMERQRENIKQAFDKNILKDHQIPDGREIWDYLRIANEEHKEQRFNLYGGDKK